MNVRRISRSSVALAASFLALLVGGAVATAPRAAAAPGNDAELDVSLQTSGARTLTLISLGSSFISSDSPPAMAARVDVVVPQGYTIDLTRKPGTTVGAFSGEITDAATGQSSPASASGLLTVLDPAVAATDPGVQACGSGSHGAVWRTTLTVLGQNLDLAILVDPSNQSAGGYVVRMCPLWPAAPPGRPAALAGVSLAFFVDTISGPTAAGDYTWSALLTPPLATTLAPDPSRTYEIRALIPIPQKLTLRARYDAKTGAATLTGRFTVHGKPQARVNVRFSASTRDADDFAIFGPVRTNAKGEFTIKRKLDQTTQFSAAVALEPRACSSPSSAPGGCRSETVAAPKSQTAVVAVPTAKDAKRVVVKSDQALAARAGIVKADFPNAESDVPDPFGLCPGFDPNLSDLTVTGSARSQVFYTDTTVAYSETDVYATDKQARTAFTRTATIGLPQCVAKEIREDDGPEVKVAAVSFPRYGSATRVFRLSIVEQGEAVYEDFVSLRVGRVIVDLVLGNVGVPFENEGTLLGKVAVRAKS